MIYLPEIAEKLENILNGITLDEPVNPTGYFFKVATTGFHLNNNYDRASKKNFIPVIIDSMGGTLNPVQGLGQGEYIIPVEIYFPVRFKNDFLLMGQFLEDAFLGANLDYGTYTGKCLSNLSPIQLGEIQNLDLTQFTQWVADTYQQTFDNMEPYMTMTFSLYLSTLANGFAFGNSFKTKLKCELTYTTLVTNGFGLDDGGIYSYSSATVLGGKNVYAWSKLVEPGSPAFYVYSFRRDISKKDKLYTYSSMTGQFTVYNHEYVYMSEPSTEATVTTPFEIEPIFDDTSIQSSSEPMAQQLIGATHPETEGYPVNTSMSAGFTVFVQTTEELYARLIQQYFDGDIQKISFELIMTLGEITFSKTCYIQSINMIIKKGSPITMTFAFVKKAS